MAEILFRNRFVAGQRLRYRGTTRVRQEVKQAGVVVDQQKHDWDAILVQKVVAVDDDGAGHIVSLAVPEYDDAEAIEGALEAQRQVTYALVDSLGNVRLASTPTPPSTYTFPDEAVAPGTLWEGTSQFALPPSGQVAHVPFIYAFRDIEESDGRTCAVVEVHTPLGEWHVPLPDQPEPVQVTMESHGQFWFDVENGVLVRSEMETQTHPILASQQVTTVTTTVQELLSIE